MSAELTLHLVEQGLSLADAKAVVALAPTSAADLKLALMEVIDCTLATAKTVAEGAPLAAPAPALRRVDLRTDNLPQVSAAGSPSGNEDPERVTVHRVNPVGADGLTDRQRAGMDRGVRKCVNCQQPTDDHLPGCSIASGFDKLAVTKGNLPPVS